MVIERGGIGPAEHLMLQQRILNAVEEVAEAGQQVAFGDDEINRKTHVERTLNEVQLLGEPAGLLRNSIGGVTDETLHREHQQKTVYRTLRTGLAEQPEEFAPFRRFGRAGLVENHRAGRVED